MPKHPCRPRLGRLLALVLAGLCLLILVGVAFYYYRQRDREEADPLRVEELATIKFSDPNATTRDWPQWRGPNRDGVSTEINLLTAWPKDGPKKLWEAKTGEGFASVAIAKGRAFTIFQDGGNESVVAWDANSGREVWRFSYPCAYTNSYGNGPRSTPSVDGKFLYSVGATGKMYCLESETDNPAGKLVWSKDLLKEFAAANLRWGVSFSPLVVDDRVLVMPGGPNGNALAALDKRTGEVLWKKHDDQASYSSPVAATFHGKPQILFLTGARLVSVAPDTGEEFWHFPWPIQLQCNIATPIVMDDYVFISTGYGKGCAMLKIDQGGAGGQPSLVYKNRRMRNHFSSCVRYKDHVYGFDDSNLACLNLRTGERTWEERGFDKGSVLLVGDQLIVYGANGILALAEANPQKYVEKSRFQFSTQHQRCWSVPVLSHGLLYVRDQEKLVCFDVRAGSH
ncbi:MAG: PQQ-like beta-propeller repeat protein [Planctomycetes bacterium]|jgi:outer membrane protein assembly factor BamB|nr:PQQ-like beta-propeller repeat protein [Planctomycetota bacterium]